MPPPKRPSLDDIASTPTPNDLAQSPAAAKDPLNSDPDLPHKLGWLGRFVGYGDQAKVSLAVVIACALFIFLVILAFIFIFSSDAVSEKVHLMITIFFGSFTGIIGWITGKKGD